MRRPGKRASVADWVKYRHWVSQQALWSFWLVHRGDPATIKRALSDLGLWHTSPQTVRHTAPTSREEDRYVKVKLTPEETYRVADALERMGQPYPVILTFMGSYLAPVMDENHRVFIRFPDGWR